jgi:hypothetical protein
MFSTLVAEFRCRFGRHGLLPALAVITLSLSGQAEAQTEWDHSKIVGPAECAECHKVTAKIWEQTHHFQTFTAMPRSKEANEIAQKMGLKRIKADSLCLNCHFTTVVKDAERDPIAGISCESCHGPAAGYLKRHGEFSGHKNKDEESAAEKAKRWADSEAAGMIRPHMTYAIAKNCMNCHTVPQEELVNKGGHPAGSNFELVSWLQGEVRHNVWYTDGKSNPEAEPERKRVLFVVGLAVELETALRAVGEATQKANYAVAMAKRAQGAAKRFQQVALALPDVPEVQAIIEAAKTAQLKLNNRDQLNQVADVVAENGMAISDEYDGSTFTAVDSLIPGPDKYKGRAQ